MNSAEALRPPPNVEAAIIKLLPGDRVRMRDHRDDSLVDGTHVGFYTKVRVRERPLVGPAALAREAARMLEVGPEMVTPLETGALLGRMFFPGVLNLVDLCVQRDGFCGVRAFVPELAALLEDLGLDPWVAT